MIKNINPIQFTDVWSHSLLLIIIGQVFEIEVFSSHGSVHIQDVFCLIFKVRSSIEASWNKQSIIRFIFDWLVSVWNFDKFLFYWTNEFECNLNLFFWLFSFNDCTDDGNVSVFLADTMNAWDHHNVNVFDKKKNVPFFLPTCLCGMMIWTDGIFSVPLIGWSKMQMHLMTFSTNLTLSFNPHFKA